MQVIFSYLPIRLKNDTESYLNYSIKNLNSQGIIPTIFSNQDFLKNLKLEYRWVNYDIDKKYKKNILWSYYKLKVLSEINEPFIHFDNDFLINDFRKIEKKLIKNKLNLCYKHAIEILQQKYFNEILSNYKKNKINEISYLNNTSVIACDDYKKINEVFENVIESINQNYDFFIEKYNKIPPITLNQQYLNNFFNEINYLFEKNPVFEDININGGCHVDDKRNLKEMIGRKTIL